MAWTTTYIRGISQETCMHKISLVEGHKPSVEPQRRLNPIIKEVVKNEIQKWQGEGSFTQNLIAHGLAKSSVSKKNGLTVVPNQKKLYCMNYRKLNKATRKIIFPFPSLVKCWTAWLDNSTTIF